MSNTEYFTLLVCALNGERLRLLTSDELAQLNRLIEAGKAVDRNGELVEETLDAGLCADDSGFVYPVRADLPFLLPEDAIGFRSQTA